MQLLMWCWAQVQAATGMSFATIMQALPVASARGFGDGGLRVHVPRNVPRKAAAVMSSSARLRWMLVIAVRVRACGCRFRTTSSRPNPPSQYVRASHYRWPGLVAHAGRRWRARVPARPPAVMAALCALARASHAYDLLPIYATIAVTWCWIVVRDRQLPVAFTGAAALVAIASAPVAFFYRQLTTDDPMWREILAQYPNAGVWTPPHLHLVVLMGLPLVLALVTLAGRRLRDDGQRFLVAWFVSAWC
jgi:hypothetical protein